MSGKRAKLNSAWRGEFNDLIRGSCGGFLFGIPLLYTMEVWWIGSFIEPPMMLAAVATAFVAVFLLNRTAGFRKTQNIRFGDAVKDTIEAMAIGFVCTTIILVLLREITLDVSRDEALGKVLFEGIPFSIGVALANLFLSGKGEANQQNGKENSVINATIADVGATAIGASIIAASIAPTDEVAMLAAGISAPWLLALMAASLLISYGIVFESGFANQDRRRQQRGLFERPLSETVMSYLVALTVAAFLLWFFQQLQFDDPLSMWLRYTLILGLPATVGGAAGRLAV